MKTNVEDWKHIPSGEIIADCLTKGVAPINLVFGSAWQCGPSWLSKSESEWPVTAFDRLNNRDDEIESEISRLYKKSSITLNTKQTIVQPDEDNTFEKLINQCSSLQQLVRLTELSLRWPGRACSNLRFNQDVPGTS